MAKPTKGSAKNQNPVRSVNPQCQIVWFKWLSDVINRRLTGSTSLLSKSTAFDISNHLVDTCTYSKNMGTAAGSFTFRLDSSRDWKKEIKPGSWCAIFMSNEGDLSLPEVRGLTSDKLPKANRDKIKKERLRGICYIERVIVSGEVDDKGVITTHFEVSGRDIGVVYEETDLWFNFFELEELAVVGLSDQLPFTNNNTLTELIDVAHDLFYAPEKRISSKTKEAIKLTEIGKQWLLPKEMLSMLKIPHSGPSFFGNITGLRNFGKTLCRIPITNPLDYIKGNAWEKLKEYSMPELHELFIELNDKGNPELIFRSIPWGIKKDKYPKLYREMKDNPLIYLDLIKKQRIDINAIDILDYTTGEDNHNRYNHFLLSMQSTVVIPESVISILKNTISPGGKTFPFLEEGSTQRHGLRKMHLSLNTFAFAAKESGANPGNGFPDAKILVEYNELIFDYWNNAIFFESGSASIIGKNEIRIGRPIVFGDDVSYNANKAFYIESYTDEFSIGANGTTEWKQDLQLTRGIEIADLQSLGGFARASRALTETGSFIKGN